MDGQTASKPQKRCPNVCIKERKGYTETLSFAEMYENNTNTKRTKQCRMSLTPTVAQWQHRYNTMYCCLQNVNICNPMNIKQFAGIEKVRIFLW